MKAGSKVGYNTGKRLGQIVQSKECSCESVIGRVGIFLKVLLAEQWSNDDTNLKIHLRRWEMNKNVVTTNINTSCYTEERCLC